MIVEIQEFARVFVNVKKLCGGIDPWLENVNRLEYKGEFLDLGELKYDVRLSQNEHRKAFCDQQLVRFIEESHRIHNSMGAEPSTRGDFITGILFQLGTYEIKCETTGQGGEYVLYEVPLENLESFKNRLDRLIAKIKKIKFFHEDENED